MPNNNNDDHPSTGNLTKFKESLQTIKKYNNVQLEENKIKNEQQIIEEILNILEIRRKEKRNPIRQFIKSLKN